MGKLSGDVSVLSVADVLQHLTSNRKEGALTLVSGENRKTIYISPNGMRLLRTTSRRTSSLGEILIRTRKITRQQLDQFLEEQKKTGKKLGEIVGRLGIVTKKDIDLALKEQVEEEIFDLFTWPDAQFEFVEGPPAIQPDTPLADQVVDASAGAIMLEAARRADELQMIMKVIRNEKMIPMKTTKPIEVTSLGENPDLIQAVYAQVTGRHTIEEVIRRSLYPRFDALRALYLLATKGFIKVFDREGATVVGLKAESTRIRISPSTSAGQPAKTPTPAPATAQPSKRTILLLGEMLKYRGILAALLREGGYEVVEEVAAQALAILTQGRKIDCVILDIGISTNDGFQFCAWLAENTTSPIIVLSTDPSRDASTRATSCGARAYIVKPFTREVIFERLTELWSPGSPRPSPAPDGVTPA
jgi:CheY-like chemotaxis protein